MEHQRQPSGTKQKSATPNGLRGAKELVPGNELTSSTDFRTDVCGKHCACRQGKVITLSKGNDKTARVSCSADLYKTSRAKDATRQLREHHVKVHNLTLSVCECHGTLQRRQSTTPAVRLHHECVAASLRKNKQSLNAAVRLYKSRQRPRVT